MIEGCVKNTKENIIKLVSLHFRMEPYIFYLYPRKSVRDTEINSMIRNAEFFKIIST